VEQVVEVLKAEKMEEEKAKCLVSWAVGVSPTFIVC
jgi:hypothetical protein